MLFSPLRFPKSLFLLRQGAAARMQTAREAERQAGRGRATPGGGSAARRPEASAPARARGPRRGAWPARPGEACSEASPAPRVLRLPRDALGRARPAAWPGSLPETSLPGAGRQSKTNGRAGLGFFKHRIFIKILIYKEKKKKIKIAILIQTKCYTETTGHKSHQASIIFACYWLLLG